MADSLGQRLELLEQAIKRATKEVERLRAERDTPKARIETFDAERAEVRALRQERKDIVSQMDAILRELDKLEL
jgi:SMC interacting uncharacterized protein involved in chromosome segregation